jgi:hypothetical protein
MTIELETGIRTTNPQNQQVCIRVDETWREIGMIAGNVAIYVPLKEVDNLIAELTKARDKAASGKQ